MPLATIALLGLAGIIAGIMNSLAGGGSFVTFPVLIWTGVNPVFANATSTVALFPGQLSGALIARRDFISSVDLSSRTLIIISVIGGAIGAVLLLNTSNAAFAGLVPYLLLFATVLFAFGNVLRRAFTIFAGKGPGFAYSLHFAVSIYGGYFGAGMGFIIIAMLQLYGISSLIAANALKLVLAVAINLVAVIIFAARGAVNWPEALIVALGGIAGNYLGVTIGRRISPQFLRYAIIALGLLLSGYFFAHASARN